MGKHSLEHKNNKQKQNVNTTTDSYTQFEEGLLRNSSNADNPNEHRSTNTNDGTITNRNESKFLNITINIKAPVQSGEEEELINSVVSKLSSFNSRNVSTTSQGSDYTTNVDNFVMPRPIKVENFDELENDNLTNETYAERIRREYGINIEDRNRQIGIKKEDDDFLSIISDIGSSTVNYSDQIISCNRKRIKQLKFDKIERMGEFSVRNTLMHSDNIPADNNEENNETDKHTNTDADELNLKEDVRCSDELQNIENSNCNVIDDNHTNILNEDTVASKTETNRENLNHNSSMEEDFDIVSSEIIENITVSHNITDSLKQTLLTSNINMDVINALKNNSSTSTEEIVNKSAAEETTVTHENEHRSKDIVLTSSDELLVKVSSDTNMSKKKVKRKKRENEMTESEEGAIYTTNINDQQTSNSVQFVKNESESAAECCSPEETLKTEVVPHDENISHLDNRSNKGLSISDRCGINGNISFIGSNDAMTTHEIIDLVVDMYHTENNHGRNEECLSKNKKVERKNISDDENKHKANVEDTILSNQESPKHSNIETDHEQQNEIVNRRLFGIGDTKVEHNDILKSESDTDDSEKCGCDKEDNQDSKLHYDKHQLEHNSSDDEIVTNTRKRKQPLHGVLSDNSSDNSGDDSSNKKENVISHFKKSSVINKNEKNYDEIATQEIIGIVMEALGNTSEGNNKTTPTKTDHKPDDNKCTENVNMTSKTSRKNEKSKQIFSKQNIKDRVDIEKLIDDSSSDSEEVTSSKLRNRRRKFDHANKKLKSRHSKHHQSDITTDTSSDEESPKKGICDLKEVTKLLKKKEASHSDIKTTKNIQKSKQAKSDILSDDTSSSSDINISSKFEKTKNQRSFNDNFQASKVTSPDVSSEQTLSNSKQSVTSASSNDTSSSSDQSVASKREKLKSPDQKLERSRNLKRSNRDLLYDISSDSEDEVQVVLQSLRTKSNRSHINKKITKIQKTKSNTLFDTSSDDEESVSWKRRESKSKSDDEDSDEALRNWRKSLPKKRNDVPLNRILEKNGKDNITEVKPQNKHQKDIQNINPNVNIQEINADDAMSAQEVLDIVMNVYNTHYNGEEKKQCSEMAKEKDTIKSKGKALSLKKNKKITDKEKSSDSENITVDTPKMLAKKRSKVKRNIANDNGESSDSMEDVVSKHLLDKFKNKTSTPNVDNKNESTKKSIKVIKETTTLNKKQNVFSDANKKLITEGGNQKTNDIPLQEMEDTVSKHMLNIKFKNKSSIPNSDNNESTKKSVKVIKETTTLNKKQNILPSTNKKLIAEADNQKTNDIPSQEILDIVMEAFGDTNKPAEAKEDNSKSNGKSLKKAVGKKTSKTRKTINEEQKLKCDSNNTDRNDLPSFNEKAESQKDISPKQNMQDKPLSSDDDEVQNIGKKLDNSWNSRSHQCSETSDSCSDREGTKVKISKERKTDILSDTSSANEENFEATKPDSSNKLQTSVISKSKKIEIRNNIPNASSDEEELKSPKKVMNSKTANISSGNSKNKKTINEKQKVNNIETKDASTTRKQPDESPKKDLLRRRSPRKSVQNKESGNNSAVQTETSAEETSKTTNETVDQNKVNTINENVSKGLNKSNLKDPVKKSKISTNTEEEGNIPEILKMVDLSPKVKDKSKKEKVKVKFDFMKLRTRQNLNKSTEKKRTLITSYLQDKPTLKAGEENEINDLTIRSTEPEEIAQCVSEKHDDDASSLKRRSPRIKEKLSKHHKDEGNNQSQKELSSEITSLNSEEIIQESEGNCITSQDILEQQNEVCLTNNPKKNDKEGVNNEDINTSHQPEADMSASLLIPGTNIEECMSSFGMETNILTESLFAQCGSNISDLNTTLDCDKTYTEPIDRSNCSPDKNQNGVSKQLEDKQTRSDVLSESPGVQSPDHRKDYQQNEQNEDHIDTHFDSESNVLNDSLVVHCGTNISTLDTISNSDKSTNRQSLDQPERICHKNPNDKQDGEQIDDIESLTSQSGTGLSNLDTTSNVDRTPGVQSLDQSKITCDSNELQKERVEKKRVENVKKCTPKEKSKSDKVHSGVKRKITEKHDDTSSSKKLKFSENRSNASAEISDDEASVDHSSNSESTSTKSLEKKKKNKEKFLEIVRKTVEDMLNDRLGEKRKLNQKKSKKAKRLKRTANSDSDKAESDASSDEDCEMQNITRKRRVSANTSQTYSPIERKEFVIECLDKLKNTKLHRSCENSSTRNDDGSSNSEDSEAEVNDISREFLDTVTKARVHMQALTSANDQLKSLDINIDFEISKLHKIAVKLTDGCSKSQRKELMKRNVKVREGHFTNREDFLIYTNFSKFVEAHGLEDDPVPFLNLGVDSPLPFAQKLKFAQTIGRGLPDRYLRAIHVRFQKLMSTRKSGSYTPEEDEIILNSKEKFNKNKSKLAALEYILRRTKKSILKRYDELMQSTEKLRCLEPISFVKKLKQVTNVADVNDLKNEISSEHWKALSGLYENIHCSHLKEYWFSSVYPRLFAKGPINLNEILQQVTQKISEMNLVHFEQVDWEKLSEPYDHVTPTFLHNSFKKACHTFVPMERQKKLRYCIKVLNKLFDKGQCMMNPIDPISLP